MSINSCSVVYVIDRPNKATRVLISKHTLYRFTRNLPYMTKSLYFLTRYDVYAHDIIVFYGDAVTHAARFRRIIFILLFSLIRPTSLVNRPK